MPAPRFHLLPWDRPLLRSAVDWLARGWDERSPLDLSDRLIIVPTRQAGRRLREALAAHAASFGQGVFPPRVLPPERFVGECAPSTGVAPATEALLAWTEVLRTCDLDAFAEVLPVAPPVRSFAWASHLARTLLHLQSTLGEHGLRLADVPRRAGTDWPDAARWEQLAGLEARYDASLARRRLRDPEAARIEAVTSAKPVVPTGVTRVILLGTPDPLPLALVLLERLAADLPVDVVVAGPDDEPAEALFDVWGRPRPEAWSQRELRLPDFATQVRPCQDPTDQAQGASNLAHAYGRPDGWLALGVADPELAAPLRSQLAAAGIAAYDPEGKPRRSEPLHHLLTTLADLAGDASFRTVEVVARCPDVLAWLHGRLGAPFSEARFLAGLDELHARFLPSTLETARDHANSLASGRYAAFPELPAALALLHELRGVLVGEAFPANVRGALGRLFEHRAFDLEDAAQARVTDAAAAWMEALQSVEDAMARFPGIEEADLWELALQAFGQTVRFDPKPAGALDLQGWLELPWEDAPHLAVVGCNDGLVPTAIVGDAFLPEALRERLGLKTNAARLARDAYLLQLLAATRARSGRLDLFFGKYSATGEPLRPSRLLLHGPDEALPERVGLLFRPIPAQGSTTAWRRAWPLAPAPPSPIARLSVTAFRSYLACPFRFYLKHGLRMQEVDPGKAELDAFDFGILCHDALEAMANDPAARDSHDLVALRTFLIGKLDRTARARHGPAFTLPLLVQLESARQRLSRAADIQAGLRAEGWATIHVESKFEIQVGGVTVVGKIDRIDRHETTGAIRVLDYKTSDQPVDPRSAHVRRPRRDEDPAAVPEWARFEIAGETLIWTDLQLPLYLRALAPEFGSAVGCGYFNLPKASSETAVVAWEGYDADWAAAAARCVEGVVAAVTTGRFWPPAELEEREDDFAALFHHGTAASVRWPPAGAEVAP